MFYIKNIIKLSSSTNNNFNSNYKYSKSSSVFVNGAQKNTWGVGKFNSFFIKKFESFNDFFYKMSDCLSFEKVISITENIAYLFLDFLLVGNLNALLLIFAFGVVLNKLVMILKKMISHEKSKKLYFLFYLVAISYILGQCLILVTSNSSDTSDQGILLLYIYVTATLMLFLIFLALTTCESYLFKDLNKPGLRDKNSITSIVVNVVFAIFIIAYYNNLMSSAIDTYFTKLAILSDVISTNSTNLEFSNLADSTVNKYSILHKSKDTSSNWSIFDNLKFDIIDNYVNYALSALLQTCALIIVIMSVIA